MKFVQTLKTLADSVARRDEIFYSSLPTTDYSEQRQRAIERLGTRWLLHPQNRVLASPEQRVLS